MVRSTIFGAEPVPPLGPVRTQNLSRELQAADRDLEERVSLSDRMLNIVAAVSDATRERNEVEMAVKAGMTDAAVQTCCDLQVFEALVSTSNDGTIDPAGTEPLPSPIWFSCAGHHPEPSIPVAHGQHFLPRGGPV